MKAHGQRVGVLVLPAVLILVCASPASLAQPVPAGLELVDATLFTSSGNATQADMILGHAVSLVVHGQPGESAFLVASFTGPPAGLPLVGGEPIAVDPSSFFTILSGAAIPASGSLSTSFVVPHGLSIGTRIWTQTALLQGASVRLTNGLELTTAGEPQQTVEQGVTSAHPLATAGGSLLIDNAIDWTTFWGLHKGIQLPLSPIPAIDFTQHSVVVSFIGFRPTSSYQAFVDTVRRGDPAMGQGMIVDVTERAPAAGCFGFAVITHPFHIVTIPVLGVTGPINQTNVSVMIMPCT